MNKQLYIALLIACLYVSTSVLRATPSAQSSSGGWTQTEVVTINDVSYVRMQALPNSDYHFTGWDDGCKRNPRMVLLSDEHTYIANFSKNNSSLYSAYFVKNATTCATTAYTRFNTESTPVAYNFTISVHPGYSFAGWAINNNIPDGVLDITRTFYLNGDSAFISAFCTEQKVAYDVVSTSPIQKQAVGKGYLYTIEQDGGYLRLLDTSYVDRHIYTLTAEAKDDYVFAGWADNAGHILSHRNPWIVRNPNGSTDYHAIFRRRNYYHYNHTPEGCLGGAYSITRVNDCNQFSLTPQPAAGYQFVKWSDESTDIPLQVTTSNQDKIYLNAIFCPEKKAYSLETTRSHGTIDTTGSFYSCCNPRFLMTAVPDDGYSFAGWTDGSKRNPHVLLPNGVETTQLTAMFRPIKMEIATAENGPTWQIDYDTVSCVPRYKFTMTNPERYEFIQWEDNLSSTAERDFTPRFNEQEYTFSYQVQKFSHLYTVTSEAAQINTTPVGTIVEARPQTACHEESETVPHVLLRAVPEDGYEFVGWVNNNDSVVSVRNPRNLSEAESPAYAKFRRKRNDLYPTFVNTGHYVTMSADRTGCDPQYTFFTPGDDHFELTRWKDADGTTIQEKTTEYVIQPQSVGETYTLVFDPYKFAFNHTITSVTPSIGTVQIDESNASVCDTVFYRLQAVPQSGYYFTGWSDGSKRNPYVLYPSRHNTTLDITAKFSNLPTTYSIYRENTRGGSFAINPPSDCSNQYTLAFNVNEGYHFIEWLNDGESDGTVPSRIETLPDRFVRSVRWAHDKMSFEDPDTDNSNTTITQLGDLCNPVFLFYARTPQPGYLFTQWDDGNTNNPRIVYPNKSQTFTASFSFAGCNSTASYLNQLCGGTVTYTAHTTGEDAPCGCTYTATATPREGYIFAGWSDNTSLIQTRDFTLDDHVEQSFTALFVSDDRKYLEWTDQALLLSTYAADLRGCNVSCYIKRTPTAPVSVSYDEQHPGRFTVPVADIAQHAGDTLKLVFHNPSTDQYVLGTDIIIPVVVADNSAWSDLKATDRIPANIDQTGVVVRDGATLTIDQTGLDMGNLDILDNSKVVVDKPINVAGITMRGDALHDQYPQLIPNANVSNTNGDTIYYDYTLDHNYYYPLALPNTTLCSDIRTRFDEPASYQAYYYDGATRATGATGWRTYNDTQPGAAFSAGQGYMLYAVARKWNGIRQEAAFMRIPFRYNMNSGEPYDKGVTVFEYNAAGAPDNDRNWNLIGNPYLANLSRDFDKGQQVHIGQLVQHMENGHWTGTYDWTGNLRYVTIPKNGFQEYKQVRIEDATLRPFNSYFIQSSGTGTLVFDVSRKASAPARVREINKEAYVDIQLSNGTHSDYTGLMVGENFTTAYEMNADLSKMMGGKEPVSVYLLDGTQPMAFLATTHDAARQTIPVGYRSTASQPMTFSLRDPLTAAALFEAVYLTDYERGTTVDLLTEQYRFTPTTSQSDTRFALNAIVRRQPTVTTDVDHSATTTNSPSSTFNNLTPGIYDLTGRRIASIDEPCTGIVPGVYIIITENEIRKEVLR